MKLRILRDMVKAYDSLYDYNRQINYKYDDVLKEIETQANEYGYKIELRNGDKFKLYKMTDEERTVFKEVGK